MSDHSILSNLVIETDETISYEVEESTRGSSSNDGAASADEAVVTEFAVPFGRVVDEPGPAFGAVVAADADASRWSKALRAIALCQ